VRKLFAGAPRLRDRVRSSGAGPSSGWLGGVLYTGRRYDTAEARKSLERSLRELRTDYVDLLLLHDPAPGDVGGDDLYDYLEDAVRSGLLRSWGVAGERDETAAIARALGDRRCVMQVRDDVFLRAARRSSGDRERSVIAYGVLGRAVPRILGYLATGDERRRRWNEAVSADCTDAETLATLLLRDALRANAAGGVLFSTVRTSRISRAVEAASADPLTPDPQLDAFRALVDRELCEGLP
jgi:aryl-alcohol dehydrogenase-like predicted oxidoreductase